MIKRYNKSITRLSMILNNLAATALFIMMVLVVGNVVLRLVGKPIQATYDYVEFLTALGIGLALAYCTVKDGHISISLLLHKLPLKMQRLIDIIIGIISVVFLIFVTWHMVKYAHTMNLRGEIAITTGTPLAPFIYIIAAGIGVFALATIGKLLNLFKNEGEE